MPDHRPLSASLQQTHTVPHVLLPPASGKRHSTLFTLAATSALAAIFLHTMSPPATTHIVGFLVYIPLACVLLRWTGFFRPALYSCCLDPRYTLLPLVFATVPGSWIIIATCLTTYLHSHLAPLPDRLNYVARDGLAVASGLYAYQLLQDTWATTFIPTAIAITVNMVIGKLADNVATSFHPKDRALERLAHHYLAALLVGGFVALIPLHVQSPPLLWMVPAIPLLVSGFRNQKHWNFRVHRESLTVYLQNEVKGQSELGVPPAAALIYKATRYVFGANSVTRLTLQNYDYRWSYSSSHAPPEEENNPPSLVTHPRYSKQTRFATQVIPLTGETCGYTAVLGPDEAPFGLLEINWPPRWARSAEVTKMLAGVVTEYAAIWARAALQHEHVTRVEHFNDLLQDQLGSIITRTSDIQTVLAENLQKTVTPDVVEALNSLLQDVNLRSVSDKKDEPKPGTDFTPRIPLGTL